MGKSSEKLPAIFVVILFALLFVFCLFSLKSIQQMQGDGRLINYLGIVRGATQRLVKLEMAHEPNDQLIRQLDELLNELQTGQGPNRLPVVDEPGLMGKIDELEVSWQVLKEGIAATRQMGVTPAFIALSEQHFVLANETVGYAEAFSNRKLNQLGQELFYLSLAIMIVGGYVAMIWYGAHKRVEKLAFIDELTEAHNVNYFRLRAANLLEQDHKQPYALVYLDINMFNYINNIFGFFRGNQILKMIANLLEKSIDAKNEISSRYINDHYLILLKYENSEELVKHLTELLGKINDSSKALIGDYTFTFSTGIYCINDHLENIDKMINYANIARKKIKSKHMNVFKFYGEDIHKQLMTQQSIETLMHKALEREEFLVYLQPKYDFKTRQIAGAEALVRWRIQDGRIVSPIHFIPIFEQNGFIAKIDLYVFERVCRLLQKWLAAGLDPVPISVNLSRIHLYDALIAEKLKQLIDTYEVPGRYIKIELTESAAFNNMDKFKEVIEQLHDLGFKLEIDDFGTGYSSLQLLRELSIDGLKIDKSIVDNIENNPRSQVIITKVIEMAKALNIQTIAEGIELSEQADLLEKIDCDLAQGFLFAKPMPIAAYEQLVYPDEQNL